MSKIILLLTVGFMAMAGSLQAATYNFNRSVGAGTVSGFLATDGSIGVLSSANFVDWSVTVSVSNINGGVATTGSMTGGNSLNFGFLTASATDIFFDFGGGDLSSGSPRRVTCHIPDGSMCLIPDGRMAVS